MHRRASDERAIRSILAIAVVFVFSWYLAILFADLLRVVGFSQEITNYALAYNVGFRMLKNFQVVFPLVCFSQSYYVCAFRSKEYRQAFKEQLRFVNILVRFKPSASAVAILSSFTNA